jgi:hypothetical protein
MQIKSLVVAITGCMRGKDTDKAGQMLRHHLRGLRALLLLFASIARKVQSIFPRMVHM